MLQEGGLQCHRSHLLAVRAWERGRGGLIFKICKMRLSFFFFLICVIARIINPFKGARKNREFSLKDILSIDH